MTNLPLVFAFTAGLFASVNPCGFALLPYVERVGALALIGAGEYLVYYLK